MDFKDFIEQQNENIFRKLAYSGAMLAGLNGGVSAKEPVPPSVYQNDIKANLPPEMGGPPVKEDPGDKYVDFISRMHFGHYDTSLFIPSAKAKFDSMSDEGKYNAYKWAIDHPTASNIWKPEHIKKIEDYHKKIAQEKAIRQKRNLELDKKEARDKVKRDFEDNRARAVLGNDYKSNTTKEKINSLSNFKEWL